jgi:hypothetical protein
VGDITAQEMDLRRAIARAKLRQSATLAEAFPVTDDEVEQEITAARAEREIRARRRDERKKKIA